MRFRYSNFWKSPYRGRGVSPLPHPPPLGRSAPSPRTPKSGTEVTDRPPQSWKQIDTYGNWVNDGYPYTSAILKNMGGNSGGTWSGRRNTIEVTWYCTVVIPWSMVFWPRYVAWYNCTMVILNEFWRGAGYNIKCPPPAPQPLTHTHTHKHTHTHTHAHTHAHTHDHMTNYMESAYIVKARNIGNLFFKISRPTQRCGFTK